MGWAVIFVDFQLDMTTEKVLIDGIGINYIHQGNVGPSILFIHGNSCSSAIWKNQFEGNLKGKYKLYALDLPGHGQSGKSSTPLITYSLQGLANVVSVFIEELALHSCFLVGHSLGGHIAIQTLAANGHIQGIFVAGAPPITRPPKMEMAFFPNQNMAYGFTPGLSEAQASALAGEFFNGPAPGQAIADILSTDPAFRKYFGETLSTLLGFDDEKIILNGSPVPRCILQAENDRLVQGKYIEGLGIDRMFQNKVHWLPHASHMIMWDQPALFDESLDAFIKSVI